MKKEYKITKEDHHWTSEEKIKWMGYGEWVEEADCVEFEYMGNKAMVVRILKKEPFAKEEAYFGGHLCGYVKVPEEHTYFRDREKTDDLDCHGGVTLNEAHEEHWIGFDCAHSGDITPTMEFFRKKRIASGELEPFPIPKEFINLPFFHPVYRNMQYCIDECKRLIDQLNEFSMETHEAQEKHPGRD